MSNPFSSTVDDTSNPFASRPAAAPSLAAAAEPSPVMAPSPVFTPPPAADGNRIAPSLTSIADSLPGVQLSEADLVAREAALSKRENEIASREKQVADAKANGTMDQIVHHPKNFPKFIKWWAYYPEDDLPPASQGMVNWIKWLFYGGVLVLFVNWIGSFCCFFSAGKSAFSSPATLIILSTIYFLVFNPLSFECVFFILYNALKEQKGMKFFCFLFMYAVYAALHTCWGLGISGWGTIGYIAMFSIFKYSTWVGIVSLIYSIVATLLVVGVVFTWIHCVRYYKKEGLDKKTFGEASKMAASYAIDNKDQIVKAATENPEVAASVAQSIAK